MKTNKIVVRYRDGSLIKGYSSDFYPDKNFFHMKPKSGEVILVDVEKLKAVFFVKDFMGDSRHKDTYKDARPWNGKKIQVHFFDDEVLVGFTLHYSSDHHGFFVAPADLGSNNEDIYVITSATRKITFLQD